MKQTLLVGALLIACFAPKSVFAGVEKFNSDEFNAIIQENLAAEQDLHNQLRQNAGIPDLRKEMNPNFAEKGREIVGVVGAENVVSLTTEHKKVSPEKRDREMMDRNLKRLSQEIQTIDEK